VVKVSNYINNMINNIHLSANFCNKTVFQYLKNIVDNTLHLLAISISRQLNLNFQLAVIISSRHKKLPGLNFTYLNQPVKLLLAELFNATYLHRHQTDDFSVILQSHTPTNFARTHTKVFVFVYLFAQLLSSG